VFAKERNFLHIIVPDLIKLHESYCILSRIRIFVIEAFTSEALEVYCILSRIRLFVIEAFTSEALEVYCILSRIRLFVIEAFTPGTHESYFLLQIVVFYSKYSKPRVFPR
jgi:hypothetical protein